MDLGRRGRGMESQAERANDLENGGKLRIAFRGQRFIQAFAPKTFFPSHFGDAARSAGNVSQGSGDQRRITVLQHGFKIRSHVLLVLK